MLKDLPSPLNGETEWPWHRSPNDHKPASLLGWPRITIITPSYNQGAFIEQTIRSVLLQEYPNLEYIVIDGGSTDLTVSILERYSAFIDYWVSEKDNGQSDAINKGLAFATGEWFNWLNSDDYLQPGALFTLAEAARNPGTVCVSGTTSNLREDHVFSRYQAHLPDTPQEFLFSLGVNQPGSLLHVDSVRELGGLRQDLRLVMDLDLWLRLCMIRGPRAFKKVKQEVAIYRYHETSKTCAAPDVFARDEFALLTDLAIHSGAELSEIIKHIPVEINNITTTSWPSPVFELDTQSIEAAWLDRMIISDSLLFRAIRASHLGTKGLFDQFLHALNLLDPLLNRYATRPLTEIKSQALIHAMQITGRAELRFVMAIIFQDRRFTTLRALARLMLS